MRVVFHCFVRKHGLGGKLYIAMIMEWWNDLCVTTLGCGTTDIDKTPQSVTFLWEWKNNVCCFKSFVGLSRGHFPPINSQTPRGSRPITPGFPPIYQNLKSSKKPHSQSTRDSEFQFHDLICISFILRLKSRFCIAHISVDSRVWNDIFFHLISRSVSMLRWCQCNLLF